MLTDLKSQILAGVAIAVLSIVTTAGSAYKIHEWNVRALKADWEATKNAAVADMKEKQRGECHAAQTEAKENADALKTKLDATNRRYFELLQYGTPSACRPPAGTVGATGGDDGQAEADLPSVRIPLVDGLAAGKMNDDQAANLITCQDVVAGIYRKFGRADLLPPKYR